MNTYAIAKTYDGQNWTLLNETVFTNSLPYLEWRDQVFGDGSPAFTMSDLNPNKFMVGGGTVIHGMLGTNQSCTYTQGSIYNSYATHADIRRLTLLSSGGSETVIAASDGGVLKNVNFNANWVNINGTGLVVSQLHDIATFNQNNKLITVNMHNDVNIGTGSNGATWAQITPTIAGFGPNSSTIMALAPGVGEYGSAYIDVTNNNHVVVVGNGEVYSSYDGASNTFTSVQKLSPYIKIVGNQRVYPDAGEPSAVLFGALITNTNTNLDSPEFYKLRTSVGANSTITYTLTDMYANPTNTECPVVIAVAPSNPNVIIHTRGGVDWNGKTNYNIPASKNVFITTVGGGAASTWTDITANMTFSKWPAPMNIYNYHLPTHIVFDPLNANRIFISFDQYEASSTNSNTGAYRVIKTENQGLTWTDMSDGLPVGPVNHMVYQNGTDDVIYAATEGGVYRYNKSLTKWECFNLGLPPVPVRALDLNYCQKKLYAATYGRGAWACDLPQAPEFHITAANVNIINGTAVSNPTLSLPANYYGQFANNVVVDGNVYLNQQGTMSFNPNHNFVVGKNAHVVLTGTMTSFCPQLWKGIQVNGSAINNQNYSGGFCANQGILEIINGGTVKNADVAVVNFTTNNSGQADVQSTGGVITCFNANFINNKMDVKLLSYPYLNKTHFTNCLFETNAMLSGSIVPEGHVSMNGLNNVYFSACNFNYAAGNAYNSSLHGYGIYALNSKFTVNDYCPIVPCTPQRGKMQNLNFGIRALSSANGFKNVNVSNYDFLNNRQEAIYLSGIDYAAITGNSVIVGTTAANIAVAGVYFNSCKYYSAQNNTVTASFNNGYSRGIVATNSYGGAHLIYRNNFDNCSYGVAVQMANAQNGVGLKIKCNTYGSNTFNTFDIANMGSGVTVDYFQGIPAQNNQSSQLAKLVGNKYGASCIGSVGPKWHVDQGGQNFQHYNNLDAVCIVTPQPQCSNLACITHTAQYFFNPSQCPDNFESPKTPTNINTGIGGRISVLNTSQNDYDTHVDGGNTATLLAVVNGSVSESSITAELQAKSPYLSDAVLSAYFTRTLVPVGSALAIHNLNKPVSDAVWQALMNRNFSEGDVATLTTQQNAEKISARQLLEAEVAVAKWNLQLAYTDKINYYLADTEAAGEDTAKATLNLANYTDKICQQIANQVSAPGCTLTAETINSLHGGTANVDDACNFYKLALQADANWNNLNTNNSLREALMSIAQNENNQAHCLARAPLEFVLGQSYQHPYLEVNEGTQGRAAHAPEPAVTEPNVEVIQLEQNHLLYIYPNPSTGALNVSFNKVQNIVYTLELRNTFGQLVYSQTISDDKIYRIENLLLDNGLYTLTILNVGKIISTSKLILNK